MAISLHGGLKGFDKVVWTAVKADVGPDGPRLVLNYLSKDGEEGFPGNLDVTATYTLTDDNALKLSYTATTDKPTVVNLTHHSYFNLNGQGNGDILGLLVYINSNQTTPVDDGLITTGEFADVTGTPFDFRTPTAIGAHINDPNTILQYGPGYDHNWVINKPLGQFGLMARVTDPTSGRVMEVWSDEPGLQFYAGNFLDGSSPARPARFIRSGPASAWSRSIIPTRRTNRVSPLRNSSPARPITTSSNINSASNNHLVKSKIL